MGKLRVLATFARSRKLSPPERLGDAVGLVARLGGWLGRTRDPPGAQLMWHGYTQLVAMAFAFELRDEYGDRSKCGNSSLDATRQGWSRRIGVCDDFMKPCLSSSGCETRPAKGEPARPVASLAPETVTDSAMRRYANEWAVSHVATKGICFPGCPGC